MHIGSSLKCAQCLQITQVTYNVMVGQDSACTQDFSGHSGNINCLADIVQFSQGNLSGIGLV